jgi:phosphoesterase RecJ-like protein
MPTSQQIQQAIGQAEHILVITHIGPDGDAFGSLTAIGQALAQWGKQATLVCDDPIPGRFRYLPLAEAVKTTAGGGAAYYDLVIAVDCGDEKRMGQVYANLPAPLPFLINIDHHITNTYFGNINFVNPEATSSAEMLYLLFREWDVIITADIALSLLTGLVTDTLGFRTMGVSARTLRIGSELMDAGADLNLVTTQGLKLKPMSTLRLWQAGLNKMKLERGLIWASLSREELKALGHTSSSSGGLVNLMSDVDQAAISAVLLEMPDGTIQVGFRCHPPYSVSELALNLGGGGHPLAAGCNLPGPLAAAELLVVKMSKEAISQQQAQLSNGH